MRKPFHLFTFISLVMILVVSSDAAVKSGAPRIKNNHFAKVKVRFLARRHPLPRTSFENEEAFLASIQWPHGDEIKVKLVYSFQDYDPEIPTGLFQSEDAQLLKVQRLRSCDSTYGAMISVYHSDANGKLSITRDGVSALGSFSRDELADSTPLACYRITPDSIPKRFRE